MGRYLMENQVFLYKNVQFRVMKSEPSDGFIDMSKTKIFCHGNAINDIKSIQLRPIQDQLPINQKTYSTQQIIDYYLKKRMYGRNEYLESEETDILSINDVTFMLTECNPSNGIFIASTSITSAAPITNREIRHIQQQKDAELARSLQENDRNNLVQQRHAMFANMNQVMMQNNNDPFMSFIRLMEQYNAMRMDGFGMQQHEEKENKGLNEQIIDSLPTYKYTETKKQTVMRMEIRKHVGFVCKNLKLVTRCERFHVFMHFIENVLINGFILMISVQSVNTH